MAFFYDYNMSNKSELAIVDFVSKTTEALTVISESTKQNAETLGGIKEMIANQNIANIKADEVINGKLDGWATMFKYVIVPLIGGILSLVGIKYLFKL